MSSADTPTLEEITELTRSELILKQGDDDDDDPIQECGCAPLDLLPRDPDMCLQVAYQHLHDVPYKDVKTCWRRYYADAALYKVLDVVGERKDTGKVEGEHGDEGCEEEEEEGEEDWATRVVKILDMTLILTGAPRREELVELWFAALRGVLREEREEASERPAKRRKLDDVHTSVSMDARIPETFPVTIASQPTLRFAIPRVSNLSLEAFQSKISKPDAQTPVIIEGAIEHWPALHERPWRRPAYLLEKTLGGKRLVPVEIGRSYTDEGWGQKILSFGEFMGEYMLQDEGTLGNEEETPPKNANGLKADHAPQHSPDDPLSSSQQTMPPSIIIPEEPPQTGYLAQHDLFAQIPSLRADISIPDYCYSEPAAQPSNLSNVKPVPKLEEPLLNAWFGPAGTISPLHTDPYHNILAQVVGYKYVRLYAPEQTERMYARGVEESGVDMSNTSRVDLDVAMRVWGEVSCWGEQNREEGEREEYEEAYPEFRKAEYLEGVLGPGDCLYLPVGWWHYVRSLTPSFSVSFWFN
ncbi:Clavaminate synthase-like protein [Trematosphaeria pertusa]|uniref:Clavaminate synthase-like protein n=1 Tax=Trematosphaeria pertusa TaxID=390896 RepID=A0A6A6ICZ3_9PLEO|nr:Clavaminate synthase-like protein [Trematosphaeria pertusa]KAF2247928.1 Clavaminate synthase-like protein [Trematosphaeria pertusa]